MTSLQSTSKEPMVTRNKSAGKKELGIQTMKTLNELLMRPCITIKKTLILKDSNNHSLHTKEVVTEGTKEAKEPLSIKKVNTQTNTASVTKKSQNGHIKPATKAKKIKSRSLLIENEEYYPERRKRIVAPKRIVLHPKHDYKVVATINKRKRRTPQRELESLPELPSCDSPEPDLSMEDLVRIADEQGLDDEDLMEILTCPSPVWWEDNDGDQEEISIRLHEDTNERDATTPEYDKNVASPMNVDETHEISQYSEVVRYANGNINSECKIGSVLKNDVNFFKKFVQKRSKLESVLGSIKSKITKPYIRHDEANKTIISNECSNKVRKDSTSGLSDASINDEELLKTLENIEIPVLQIDSDDDEPKVEDFGTYTDLAVLTRLPPSEVKGAKKRCRTSNRLHCKAKKNFCKLKKKADKANRIKKNDLIIKRKVTKTDMRIVPVELPPLTKKPFRNIRQKSTCESPKSTGSITSEVTNSSHEVIELDSISDTNIKFLDEDVEDTDNKTEDVRNIHKGIPKQKSGDLITVYKILPNTKDSNDIEDHIDASLVNRSVEFKESWEVNRGNGKMNCFYKKCKNTHLNKKKNDGLDDFDGPHQVKREAKPVNKYGNQKCKNRLINTKSVPNTRVKYCHKCSCIFETEACHYCTKKSRKKNLKTVNLPMSRV